MAVCPEAARPVSAPLTWDVIAADVERGVPAPGLPVDDFHDLVDRLWGRVEPVVEERDRLLCHVAQTARERAFIADVRSIHGWALAGDEGQCHARLQVIYGCLYELWAAEREQRAYLPYLHRS